MTILLAIVLTTLHLEDDDLVTLYEWVHNFYYYFCTFYSGCTDSDCAVIVNEQNLVELNSLACLYILNVMYEELLALLSLKLLTVNFYDCVHYFLYKRFSPQGGLLRADTCLSLVEILFL